MKSRALYVLVLFFGACAWSGAEPEVNTRFGAVRGVWLKTARGAEIAGFLGIPYAEPPVGELRFENPRPWSEKWNATRNATSDGSMCVQKSDSGAVVGSEDCLFLNVFTPTISRNQSDAKPKKLSVIVFIHGGSFYGGSSNSTLFAPTYLLDQEIILVTMNYRLNVLGFFSAGNEVTPGNYGLKDMATALAWVHDNVAAFGGDPASVTLLGQSSGAASAQLLTFSKATSKFVHKLITMSGSATAQWAVHSREDIRNTSMRVARLLGCEDEISIDEELVIDGELSSGNATNVTTTATASTTTEISETDKLKKMDKKILECMKRANLTDIINYGHSLSVWRRNPVCTFGPTLEAEAEGAILTVHPARSLSDGLFKDIPWITGVTEDEGLLKTTDLFLNSEIKDELLKDYERLLVPYVLEMEHVVDNFTAATDAITSFYFKGDVEANLESNITQLVGDALITWSSYDVLQRQAAKMKSNVYFYVFAYEGTFSNTFRDGIPFRFGVDHGDDVNYLFPYLNKKFADVQLFTTMGDRTIINILTEMWANFAITGVPSARLTLSWEPYQKNHRFMRFGDGKSSHRSLLKDFSPERMSFWSSFMKNYSLPITEYIVNEKKEGKKGEETKGKGGSASIHLIDYALYLCLAVVWIRRSAF